MASTSTLRSLTVLIVAGITVVAASVGFFAVAFGEDDLTANAQTDDCWTNVWGTDNNGHFFTVIAGDGCPEYRGRVFAGTFQRGPTVASRDGEAKMTGIDACIYDTVEVKAVERDGEAVLYRFTWSAEQLGCDDGTSASDSATTTTAGAAPTTTTALAANGADFVPFSGALVTVTERADGCEISVTGTGNNTYDITLNGIAKLVNGTVAAQPFFSLWISGEGGDRWTDGAFHAASLTEDCQIDVHQTLADPTPAANPGPAPTIAPEPPTTNTVPAPTTTAATSTTTTANATTATGASFSIDLGEDVIIVERCGSEFGTELVCIHESDGAWINVDAVDGFGRFDHLDGNTVVYALEDDVLKFALRTATRSTPVTFELDFG